jgi:hypothetical protein
MLQENNNLNKQLKKMIIILGLSLIMGIIALIIAFMLKKNLSPNKEEVSIATLSLQNAINDNFSETCQPLTIEYKENYIAINSKKCNKILIINPNTGKETYRQY